MLAVTMLEAQDGQEREVESFFKHVRMFYEAFVCKVINKCPFKSSLLSDPRVLIPEERTTVSDFPNTVVRLAKQFPQLGLENKLDDMGTEALDFQMADLPAISDIDEFWATMDNVKSMDT